jgi:hypothetical protein
MSIHLGRRFASLAAVVGFGTFGSEAAAETFEYLTYAPPPGWTEGQAQDGKTYLYQDATAAVVVVLFKSRPTEQSPAAAFAEEWRGRVARVVTTEPPAPHLGQEGDVTVAAGSVQASLQGKPVTVVLATLVGRGRTLSVLAIASGDGGKHVSAFLGTLHVALAAPPSAAADEASRDKRRPGRSAQLAGLYLWQGHEYTFRVDFSGRTGGSGGSAFVTHFVLLSEDGKVARGSGLPPVPDGDLRRFDFEDYRRRNPGASGTYTLEGERLKLHMGAGTSVADTLVAKIVADGEIEIEKRRYTRSVKPR